MPAKYLQENWLEGTKIDKDMRQPWRRLILHLSIWDAEGSISQCKIDVQNNQGRRLKNFC